MKCCENEPRLLLGSTREMRISLLRKGFVYPFEAAKAV